VLLDLRWLAFLVHGRNKPRSRPLAATWAAVRLILVNPKVPLMNAAAGL
jgi:hypothetical protein